MKVATRRWGALLAVTLLALGPSAAVGEDQRSDRILTLEVSLQDFIELQRLDDGDRRLLLGLPATCSPGITAVTGNVAASRRMLVLVVCGPIPEN